MNTLIRPIKTESDYKDALVRVNSLMDAQATQSVKDELEVLATLIEIYEDEHFPIGKPSPSEAIKFRMDQMGLTNRDLIPLIGSRSKVSEILSGKCNLTLMDNGAPVIGLTLRYDRIDNFWFCLCHELAHIGRHIKDRENIVFIDDITSQNFYYEDDKIENEANEWAQYATIPDRDKFNNLLNGPQTSKKIVNLAAEMEIHPAIIAGRVRHELKNYRLLSNFVGHGEVRKYFKTEIDRN